MELVAKSYQNCPQIGNVYQKNGKDYIKIKEVCDRCGGSGGSSHPSWAAHDSGRCFKCGGSGHTYKEVRVYSQKEYDSMVRLAEKAKERKEEERVSNIDKVNNETKIKCGFEHGYIMVVLGDTYSIKEELKELGAHFNHAFGWYFFGGSEPNTNTFEYFKVNWEDASEFKGDYIRLKPEEDLKSWIKSLTTKPSNSEYQGIVGVRIQFFGIVKAIYSFNSRYGTSYLHNIEDEQGNVYVWTTSSKCLEQHSLHLIQGIVKEHKLYNDIKQTILTRCKILS